jgi:hypothetical protein
MRSISWNDADQPLIDRLDRGFNSAQNQAASLRPKQSRDLSQETGKFLYDFR